MSLARCLRQAQGCFWSPRCGLYIGSTAMVRSYLEGEDGNFRRPCFRNPVSANHDDDRRANDRQRETHACTGPESLVLSCPLAWRTKIE